MVGVSFQSTGTQPRIWFECLFWLLQKVIGMMSHALNLKKRWNGLKNDRLKRVWVGFAVFCFAFFAGMAVA